MPIIRYFVSAGGLLLAPLFAADLYLPASVDRAGLPDQDRTIIRIASARTLPEKIVFDTRPRADLPTIAQADPLPRRASKRAKSWLRCLQHLSPRSKKTRLRAPPQRRARIRSARQSYREGHPTGVSPSSGPAHLEADGGDEMLMSKRKGRSFRSAARCMRIDFADQRR